MVVGHSLVLLVPHAAPADEDVVAGPIGFVIFIGLVVAVAILGLSLNKHLKKAHRAADAGAYGDPPVDPADSVEPGGPGSDGATDHENR